MLFRFFGVDLFHFDGAFSDQSCKSPQSSEERCGHERNRSGTGAKGEWDFQYRSAFMQNADTADITLVDKLFDFINQLTTGDGIFFGGLCGLLLLPTHTVAK